MESINDTKRQIIGRKRSNSEENEANIQLTLEDNTANMLQKLITNDDTVNERQGIFQLTKNPLKRQRKSKKETSGRTHTCTLCNKCYLSYPALYTHKRNKHNIIPITGKPEIFKTGGPSSSANKFKYNVLDSKFDVKGITEAIIEEYLKYCEKVYSNPDSLNYNPYFNPETNSFIKLLKYYSNIDKIRIPKANEKERLFIDNILITYVILIIEVTRDSFFFNIILQFVFLLREYLNLMGWDHLTYLNQYGLYDNLSIQSDFCISVNCEEVPELVNDFICVYLEMHELGEETKKQITDITQNFCFWLFINGLTNYKLTKTENSVISSNKIDFNY